MRIAVFGSPRMNGLHAHCIETSALISWIDCPEAAIEPELGSIPQIHQPEHTHADPPFAGFVVELEQMQFLESPECLEWEIDLDAVWIENLPVEFVCQSFTYQQLFDFGAPARSHRVIRCGSS